MERALRTVKTLSDISPTLNGHSRDGGDWVRLLTASPPPNPVRPSKSAPELP